jgi:peptidoglycan/xylan/chitin deacetylase (PgdA/CDA1 family)
MRLRGQIPFLNWYKRHAAKGLYQRRVAINAAVPYISFTFDDFPKSALHLGGEILKECGLAGTYFVSLGLLGCDSPSGRLCTADDLVYALEQGHELGCHTFAHCHSWDTPSAVFEESIVRNRTALKEIIPGAEFRTFSYPIATPRPSIKRACAKYFECSRAGGQKWNAESADLNQLSAYFLEKARGSVQDVKDLIGKNKESRGWLVFATHDVDTDPSEYGCTPKFFEDTVRAAIESGARILPMVGVLDSLHFRG